MSIIDDTDDLRLNPDFISEKLLEVFIKNKEPNENYTASIDATENDVIIKNHGKDCYILTPPSVKDGLYVIEGGLNLKCSDNKSGTRNLMNVIEFGKRNGYDSFHLLNTSELKFGSLEIDLTLLKLLTIGNSWYSQFGFQNANSLIYQEFLMTYINRDFIYLISKYNTFIDSIKDFSIVQKNTIKEQFSSNIKILIDDLEMPCNYNPNINIKSNISVFFANIQDCLYDMKERTKMINKYQFISSKQRLLTHSQPLEIEKDPLDIDIFNDALLKIKQFIEYIIATIFIIEYKIRQPVAQVVSLIKSKYNKLQLDFSYVTLSSGGRSKPNRKNRKSKKRNRNKQPIQKKKTKARK